MTVKEMIIKAAKSEKITGVMNIAEEVEKCGVTYSRLNKLMSGKGNVIDLIAILNHFEFELKSVPMRGGVK